MKLPYTKTTIRDLSQFTNIGDGSTGVNIATVINAKTGPMDRITLTSFDDLVNYYCTGTAITQKDDTTIQCIGALLNTSAVDVIRVGSSKMFIGKTDDNKIIYTDSNFNLIDKLSRISISDNSERENCIAVNSDDTVYYVGDRPSQKFENADYFETNDNYDVTSEELAKVIYNTNNCGTLTYDSSNVYFSEPYNFYDTDTADVTTTFINAKNKIEAIKEQSVPTNIGLIIDNVTYGEIAQKAGGATYFEPIQQIPMFGNEIPSEKFLASVISTLPSNSIASYKVNYDFSKVDEYSDILNERMFNKTYNYSRNVEYNQLYIITTDKYVNTTKHICAFNISDISKITDGDSYTLVTTDAEGVELREEEYYYLKGDSNIKYYWHYFEGSITDFAQIIATFESDSNIDQELIPVTDSVVYLVDSAIFYDNVVPAFEISDCEGIYQCNIRPIEYTVQDYSVFIDGYTYYCGNEPTGLYSSIDKDTGIKTDDTIEYVTISEDKLIFTDFIELLIKQLLNDMVIGVVNSSTFLLNGNISVRKSDNLNMVKTIVDQANTVQNSKFALVAKFPTSQKLFSYSYMRDYTIENYDIININWVYNQMSGNMSVGFDENAVDGNGTLLYYTKYNEGDYENSYFHIMHFNDFVKWDKSDDTARDNAVYIGAFGNELIMPEPNATDYANAIKKFIDYDDKMYSFIWDAGYANTTLAKAMNIVAIEKNAQFVPSFPSTCKTVDAVKAYHQALGLDTPEGIEIVPAFKGTYCGSFLTTVPGGLAYMVARINAFNNTTSEFKPLFGPTYGSVNAPNLMWSINKTDQQSLADMNINSIISNKNGTYLNYNLTSQKISSYLSEEQNMYMSNCIAHVCEEYNPKLIGSINDVDLWNQVVNQLTDLLETRMMAGKANNQKPVAFRVICNDKLNTQDVIEARQLKYKVQVKLPRSISFVDAYVDVVRLDSF